MKTTTLRQELITNTETAVGREYLLFLDYDKNPRLLTTLKYAFEFSSAQGFYGPYRAVIHTTLLDVPLFLGGIEVEAPLGATSAVERILTGTYTNWKNEVAKRSFIPSKLWFGSTDWHPEPQWLLTAWDVEKQAWRDFAFSGFLQ
jgi:hypothetical protein